MLYLTGCPLLPSGCLRHSGAGRHEKVPAAVLREAVHFLKFSYAGGWMIAGRLVGWLAGWRMVVWQGGCVGFMRFAGRSAPLRLWPCMQHSSAARKKHHIWLFCPLASTRLAPPNLSCPVELPCPGCYSVQLAAQGGGPVQRPRPTGLVLHTARPTKGGAGWQHLLSS